eukprot:TRINITY_DN22141_c0_g1_i1.p1 TRINITY_DN22141_c0_g1~~TRINITY_DN22141_c0_g1_i1.p1  ORF type:complete len:360 (+),score=107.88 TRINITY_DN22141_c0_g1_i1:146-1081(+)
MALVGLQQLCDSPAADPVLHALAPFAAQCTGPLSAREAGAALYGMRAAPITQGTERLLAVLALLLARPAPDRFDSQAVANTLYGLQGQRGGAAVESVLGALTPRIADCGEPLAAGAVGPALFGLRDIPTCPATDALLPVLARLVRGCEGGFSPADVGQSLYGLKSQQETSAALEVLEALVPLAAACTAPFEARALGMALLGFSYLGLTGHPAAEQMLELLASRAAESPEPLNAVTAHCAVSGLRHLPRTPAVTKVLGVLAANSASAPSPGAPVDVGYILHYLDTRPVPPDFKVQRNWGSRDGLQSRRGRAW